MNIEAYNLDSLRKLVRSLQEENIKLKAQLNFGVERMFMPKEAQRAAISRSAITGGIIRYAPNSVVKKSAVNLVNTNHGQSLRQRKS